MNGYAQISERKSPPIHVAMRPAHTPQRRLSRNTFSPVAPTVRAVSPRLHVRANSLHQSLEGSASFGDLREGSPRPLEMREKLLVFVDGLILLAGALVQLAQVIVGKDFQRRETSHKEPEVSLVTPEK